MICGVVFPFSWLTFQFSLLAIQLGNFRWCFHFSIVYFSHAHGPVELIGSVMIFFFFTSWLLRNTWNCDDDKFNTTFFFHRRFTIAVSSTFFLFLNINFSFHVKLLFLFFPSHSIFGGYFLLFGEFRFLLIRSDDVSFFLFAHNRGWTISTVNFLLLIKHFYFCFNYFIALVDPMIHPLLIRCWRIILVFYKWFCPRSPPNSIDQLIERVPRGNCDWLEVFLFLISKEQLRNYLQEMKWNNSIWSPRFFFFFVAAQRAIRPINTPR